MEIKEKREYIKQHLNKVDERLINDIYQKMVDIVEEPIVGYTANGNPIQKKQLLADLKEAEEQIEKGESITLDELEKESEEW